MKCKICDAESRLVKTLTVRQRYEASYYHCDNCGFMFVGNPTWLDEAYESPINITDTGYVGRNIYMSRKALVVFFQLFSKNATYVDYAGGYGMYTRLMRDYGLNFLWEDKYTENLFSKGFEYDKNNTSTKIDALTSFECFEHLPNPKDEIDALFSISKNIFFSTVLLPDSIPPSDDWEYYGLNHGQHVAFYSKKTLQHLAKKYNVTLCTNNKNIHMFTNQKVSNWYFNFLLNITRLGADFLIKKIFLKTKTYSDNVALKAKGLS